MVNHSIILTIDNVYDVVLGKTTDEELCPICGKGEDTGEAMVGCNKATQT